MADLTIQSQAGGKPFIENSSLICQAICSGQHKGCEGSMLHFSNSLLILSLLFQFVFSVAVRVSVGRGMWIENSHVYVRALKSSTPEPICCNIQPCTILNIASELFAIDGLEIWLDADIVAHL